jgi:hypothetical protein
VFHADTMPRAWVNNLSKLQLEQLASQLSLPTDGALDDLRKRVREKWSTIEACLPSPILDKSSPIAESAQPGTDASVSPRNDASKVRLKLVTDLVQGIPVLSGTDPEAILKFLIRVNQIWELKLISDSEFLAVLIGRTSGRVMQILGTHLAIQNAWGIVQSNIIATFLPPRVKERFMLSYVTERFQSSGEDLNSYVMSVVAAAAILGFAGTEQQLVHRMVQNMHPSVKAYCLFESRPVTVRELYSLATTVAEAVAVEDQRMRLNASGPQSATPRNLASAVVKTERSSAGADRRSECWRCGVVGHFARHCSGGARNNQGPARSGNADGARQ